MADQKEVYESDYKLLSSCTIGGIPVVKYISNKTQLIVSIAQVEGPLVNGFFCLATEAHDHDGLPHTLEHLIFLGSEKYPYKGVLDLLANRCLAQGTNAWTDVDHTCYTVTTAGSEGFLNLLPIYLDHILYPTLTDSGFLTEVHHINGEGENAGVVYCEMQARENTSEDLTHFHMLQLMYPEDCGYRSETGGRLLELRTSTSNEKVRSYHRGNYRPDNLNLIITGQIEPNEVFKALEEFEQKIISKGPLPPFTQPWQSPIAPLTDSVTKEVPFPTSEEDDGVIRIAWRGPMAKERYFMIATEILMEYLTDTPVSPLQRDLVEIEDPYCSDVDVLQLENSVSVFGLTLEGVPYDKLNTTADKVLQVLRNLSEGKESFDMIRMTNILKQRIIKILNQVEESPHYFFTFSLIGDFLFRPENLGDYLDQVPRFESLLKESESFWKDLLNKYFVSAPNITILGTPSADLAERIGREEKERIAVQCKELGEEGLKEKQKQLEESIAQNEIPPPNDMISSIAVPSVESISFHPIQVLANHKVGGVKGGVAPSDIYNKFPVDKIQFFIQVNHICSKFVEFKAILDTGKVPHKLRPYLTLYSELLFESPVLRNGEVIPHETVVKELQADTISHGASLGIKRGSRFSPGQFPDGLMVSIKVESSKYSKGVAWLYDILYNVQFTVERINIVANKLINDVSRMKREGTCVAKLLMDYIILSHESNKNLSNMVTQAKFLTQLQEGLKDPQTAQSIVTDMSVVKGLITDPANFRLFIDADVNSLPEEGWKELNIFPTSSVTPSSLPPIPFALTHAIPTSIGHGLIAGVGGLESNYLIQSLPCITDYTHPDLAPIMVYMECLGTLEGPMWRQIRGMGLSYHYSLNCNPQSGLLSFVLYKSTQLVQAYEVAKNIVAKYVTGEDKFDQTQLESAKSCVIFEVIERETTIGSAGKEALLSHFYNVPTDYNKQFLQLVSQVTISDLERVGGAYFHHLFDAQKVSCSVTCSPSKVNEIREEFKKYGHSLQVVDDIDTLAVNLE